MRHVVGPTLFLLAGLSPLLIFSQQSTPDWTITLSAICLIVFLVWGGTALAHWSLKVSTWLVAAVGLILATIGATAFHRLSGVAASDFFFLLTVLVCLFLFIRWNHGRLVRRLEAGRNRSELALDLHHAIPSYEIKQVTFFQKQNAATDYICCEIKTAANTTEFCEGSAGWSSVVRYVETLPEFDINWHTMVMKTPFARNETVAFRR